MLNKDPLARIMYGSRELFHSNVLAWLLDSFPELASLFDLVGTENPIGGESSTKPVVRREYLNLDLYIEHKHGASIAIENKVFSLPRTDQLDKYSTRLASKKGPIPSGILLSLSGPGWETHSSSPMGVGVVWRPLSYGQLADRLQMRLPGACPGKSYELETAHRYVNLIRHLQEVANLVNVDDDGEPVFLASELPNHIDRQFVAAIAKLRAHMVISHLTSKIPESAVERTAGAGMSNGTPIVEMSYRKNALSRAHRYGWQMQGSQLRLCAVLPDLAGRSHVARTNRIEWGTENAHLFDFSQITPLTGGERTVRPDSFNRFDPDFIYRYILTPDLTVGQLTDVARQRQHEVEEAILLSN
ncbi:PD-(D/E)XK nuclease family protein [Gordonia terrae]|uniref:PD-(D/E)XK nuclease family protein n=1 Tax=Gordonia terrae TaxID=2055 RepID=UPI00200AF8CE|nr:PD-(D/E)XK nuclease family protein [Gordonia terrae]UPW11575.1 PD-(D/E)XK nuclease family protein [Gordonia terrae]